MTYGSLCTGVGGFDLGFDRAGMKCVFQCEQCKHCLTVLKRNWPEVSRTEDVNDERTESELVRLRPDVVCFGSPCQDLSVAGKRGGLAGQRSGLFFRCVELCFACEAKRVVWENVPGVFSSNGGHDFAAVLAAFTGYCPSVPPSGWRHTGVCVGQLYSVAWAVLDSQWRGLAQRRDRVFLVADFDKRSSPYEILSLAESLPWDSPPSREAGTRVAGTIAAGAHASGFNGRDAERGNIVNQAQAYQCHGSDVGEMGTIRAGNGHVTGGVPFIVNALDAHMGMGGVDDNAAAAAHIVCHPVEQLKATAYRTSGNCGVMEQGDKTAALNCASDPCQNIVTVYNPHRTLMKDGSVQEGFKPDEITDALHGPTGNKDPLVAANTGVRRLLPIECERLQGFPDGWTEGLSDSARYRVLGNAVSVPVAEWIGRRMNP